MKFRRIIALFLVFCILTPQAYAEDGKGNNTNTISGWLQQATNDTSAWASQTWKTVTSAWGNGTTWMSTNLERFTNWVDMAMSDNPYSWIDDAIERNGIIAFDRFSDLRSFLNSTPTVAMLQDRDYKSLTALSLLNEDKTTILNALEKWSIENGIAQNKTLILTMPFVDNLLIEGEAVIGKDIFSGQDIAQYLFTVLETMKISSDAEADKKISHLNSVLEALTCPVVIGDDFQNVLITNDHSYIENFTYADGKYQIFLVATRKSDNSDYPIIRGKNLSQAVENYFSDVTFLDEITSNESDTNKSQSIKFETTIGNVPVRGKVIAVWNKVNTYLLFVITDKEWVDGEIDNWYNSVSFENYDELHLAVDPTSDGAFHGVNQVSQKYTINRIFDEDKFMAPKGGRGWAAERGNNLIDNLKGLFIGKHSVVIGDNNAVNGADRLVTYANGSTVYIQSKYYADATQSIGSCFENGQFRYFDAEGNPMKIEVPADQYEAALTKMQARILNGEIKGVTDPEAAKTIIQKGALTYQQARHIAQAGTVESILYDSAHGCVVAGTSMGLSAAVELALGIWSGESLDAAIKSSLWRGLQVGGQSFVISVLSSQIAKSSINTAMIPASKVMAHTLGPKVSAVIVNAFRPAGSAIYGAAAMQSAAKLLRGGVITSAVTVTVLTTADVVNIIQGKISWKQLAKNATTTVVGVTGGYAGYLGGSAIGTAIMPGPGTVIGGILGSVVVSMGTSAGVKAVADLIVEDDANEMIKIIEEQFAIIAGEYFLNEDEALQAVENLQSNVSAGTLKKMYQSKDRTLFARQLIELSINPVVKNREYINLPSDEEYAVYLTNVLEEIYEDVNRAED